MSVELAGEGLIVASSANLHSTASGLTGKQITVTCETIAPYVERPVNVGDILTFNDKPQRYVVVDVDPASGGFGIRPID